MTYIAVIHHEEGSAYGAHFPDVPGCFAAADTSADILKNAIAALDDYFADGHEVVKPRDIEAIKKEATEDLAEGAYLLAVPYIARSTKSVRNNVSMDRAMWAAIDDAADLAGLTRSAFLAMAARKEIQQEYSDA
jgi:predicted RNase H-like HicB family nuclease